MPFRLTSFALGWSIVFFGVVFEFDDVASRKWATIPTQVKYDQGPTQAIFTPSLPPSPAALRLEHQQDGSLTKMGKRTSALTGKEKTIDEKLSAFK